MSSDLQSFPPLGGSTPLTRRAAREAERYHAQMDCREQVVRREGDLFATKVDALGTFVGFGHAVLARDAEIRKQFETALPDPALSDDMALIHRTLLFGVAALGHDLTNRLRRA